MDLFASFGSKIDGFLAGWITWNAIAIIQWLKPIFNNLLIIYVALWGFAHMMGKIDELLIDGLIRIIKISIVITFALNILIYAPWVIRLFYYGPQEISDQIGLVNGVTGTSISGLDLLDQVLSKIFEIGNKAWQLGGVTNLGFSILAILIYAGGVAVTAYAAALIIMSKVAIGLLLSIGPIFIVLSLFETTKKFLDAWLIQLVNYSFLIILILTTVNLFLGITLFYINQLVGYDDLRLAETFSFLALCLISLLIFLQIPQISQALAGGVALSTLGGIRAGWNRLQGGMGRIGHNARPTTWSRRFDIAKREYQATTRYPRYLNSLRSRNQISK